MLQICETKYLMSVITKISLLKLFPGNLLYLYQKNMQTFLWYAWISLEKIYFIILLISSFENYFFIIFSSGIDWPWFRCLPLRKHELFFKFYFLSDSSILLFFCIVEIYNSRYWKWLEVNRKSSLSRKMQKDRQNLRRLNLQRGLKIKHLYTVVLFVR